MYLVRFYRGESVRNYAVTLIKTIPKFVFPEVYLNLVKLLLVLLQSVNLLPYI